MAKEVDAQRLRQIIYFAKEKHGLSQKDLAMKLEMSPQYLSDLAKGRKSQEKVNECVERISTLLNMPTETPSKPAPVGLPYYSDLYAQGGTPHGFSDIIPNEPDGLMSVPEFLGLSDAFFIQVRGNSMFNPHDPELSMPNGSWVALRPCRSSSVQWGEIYAFITFDGPLIKKIMPGETDETITCVSLNEEKYPPFQLRTSEIYGNSFHHVLGVVHSSLFRL